MSIPIPVGIDANDLIIPKLYIGQDLSAAVKSRLAERGDLYVAAGQDDQEPTVLDQPVEVFVLALEKTLALTQDGEYTVWQLDDPDAPNDAEIEYRFTLAIPEFSEQLPVKWRLSRTGSTAARQMLTAISLAGVAAQPWALPFALTTVERKKDRFSWYTPQVKAGDASQDCIDAAASIAAQLPAPRNAAPAPRVSDEPSI